MYKTFKLNVGTDVTPDELQRIIEAGTENGAPFFLFGVFYEGFDLATFNDYTFRLCWGGTAWVVKKNGTDSVVGTCILEGQSILDLPYCNIDYWVFDPLDFRFSTFDIIEDKYLICGFEMYVQKKDQAPELVTLTPVTSFQFGTMFSFPYTGLISEIMYVGFFSMGDQSYSIIETDPAYRHAMTDSGQLYLPIDASWDLVLSPGEETPFFEAVMSNLIPCPNYLEDRTKRQFTSFKLPKSFTEENRGVQGCCCKHLMLGGGSETWQKDTTSMWFKRADEGDVVSFQAIHNGVDISEFLPAPTQFPNDPNAVFVTVDWTSILAEYGVGCVELGISYTIAGLTGTIAWGEYDLKPFSVENAMGTARIRAIFNGYHEADGIDFTGSNVESCIRFQGFIGHRQPNTEMDNIIYSDRQMKRVIRENLNTYEILTDPLDECIIRPIVDVFLLSENQLFISDYNDHNHSYRFNDVPVIVEQSAVIAYYDWSRKAKLTAVVGDKFKNQRTYFK